MAGTFIISLDFELRWGLRDHLPRSAKADDLVFRTREAIPRLLRLLERYEIAATWATVGMLFCRDRDEWEHWKPACLPAYRDRSLCPYGEPPGSNEREDPLHYGATLIEHILATPGQEVASHTYGHIYAREPGMSREAFDADLGSAISIAADRGVVLKSFVFPRNQVRTDFLELLSSHGLAAYRGNEPGWMYPDEGEGVRQRSPYRSRLHRAGRLAETFVRWPGAKERCTGHALGGPVRVPSSLFFRPLSNRSAIFERFQLQRVFGEMEWAARKGEVFHLWWHPHNMAIRTDQQLSLLERVFVHRRKMEEEFGMSSVSMSQWAEEHLLTSQLREKESTGGQGKKQSNREGVMSNG